MDKLDPLTEAECYARCYGEPGRSYVRVIPAEHQQRSFAAAIGEILRQTFEDGMGATAPEAA